MFSDEKFINFYQVLLINQKSIVEEARQFQGIPLLQDGGFLIFLHARSVPVI